MSKENNIKTYEELLAEIEKLTKQVNESAKQDELSRLEATKRLDIHNQLILNIKDKNIVFSDKPASKEYIHGELCNVFEATLSPDCPHRCENCGKTNVNHSIVKHSPKASLIQVISYQRILIQQEVLTIQ